MLPVSDWEQFLRSVPWFVQTGEHAGVGAPRPWDRGSVDGLPELSALLGAATVTPVSRGDSAFELLAWGPADRRRGWLCKPPGPAAEESVPALHRAFWTVCGGLVEQFNGPSTWWDNLDQVLTVAAFEVSVAEALTAYSWIWENHGLRVPINPDEYYPAAIESNGNLTLAHRRDGRLLLFAPDHAFEGVTPFAGSPPYSLYTIDAVPDLATWIEVCAAAWSRTQGE
jgi:hypothetical protein